MTFNVEDFRERWRHMDPQYPEVCGLPNEDESRVCILPLCHEEPHGWDDEAPEAG